MIEEACGFCLFNFNGKKALSLRQYRSYKTMASMLAMSILSKFTSGCVKFKGQKINGLSGVGRNYWLETGSPVNENGRFNDFCLSG